MKHRCWYCRRLDSLRLICWDRVWRESCKEVGFDESCIAIRIRDFLIQWNSTCQFLLVCPASQCPGVLLVSRLCRGRFRCLLMNLSEGCCDEPTVLTILWYHELSRCRLNYSWLCLSSESKSTHVASQATERIHSHPNSTREPG